MRTPTDQPNIVLINCDDLGYGDLSCYGSSVNRTPNIDRLAGQGVRFTDFYMASPVCSPSRGAMMTGCYPPRISFGDFNGSWVLFPGNDCGLSTDEITIARLLKDRGYATKLVGKWHCGDQKEFLPTRHGFDSYYGLPYSNDMGRQRGRNRETPLPLVRDEEVIQQQPDQANLIERYTEESVRFLRDNREEPFFLYLAHMQVHLPLYAPQRFLDRSQNGRFGACVEAVDWSTAVIMNELQRLDLEDNTIVIFTSDNGARGDNGSSNAPLRGKKGTTWEGGQRVPCIIRWPGQIQAGQTRNDIMSSIDFYPTLANLAGAEVPKDRIIDGLDFSEMLLGRAEAGPRDTFFYYLSNSLNAVRRGTWKLHVNQGGRPWQNEKDQSLRDLYDLQADPGETTNLYDQHPEIVEQLQGLLDACREDMGDAVTETKGKNVREKGWVQNAVPLAIYDENYPYIEAEYDLSECG